MQAQRQPYRAEHVSARIVSSGMLDYLIQETGKSSISGEGRVACHAPCAATT